MQSRVLERIERTTSRVSAAQDHLERATKADGYPHAMLIHIQEATEWLVRAVGQLELIEAALQRDLGIDEKEAQ